MTVIKVEEAMKNTLIIGLDVVLIRAKNTEDNIKSITNNFISEECGMQKQIKELASSCKKIDENLCIAVYKEFKDGFSLLLHCIQIRVFCYAY